MDSGTLRIILLVFGILLIAGIYLWERRKTDRQRKSARAALVEEHIAADAAQHNDDDIHHDEALSRHLDELETIVRKQEAVVAPQPVEDDLHEENIGDEAMVPAEPQQVLMLSVVTKRKYFTGDAIMSAMRSVNLQPGENDIFYRYLDGNEDTVFGVANMTEPGVFPLKDMGRFTTPGITLFAALPGALPGMQVFDDLYETAERLAAFLDGTLHDSGHNPLTNEELEHMRELADTFSSGEQ